jgi:hypothetical protein
VVLAIGELALAADRQRLVLEFDLEVAGGEAGNVHVHRDAVVVDEQVGRGHERGDGAPVAAEHAVDVAQPGRDRLHECGHAPRSRTPRGRVN